MILHRSAASKDKELAQYRATAVARCNQMTGDIRLLFITDIPGQGAVYAEKELEAIDYISHDPEPTDLSSYPFIEQEMLATDMTAYQCGQLFLNMAARWRPLGAQLEGVRIKYNKSINNAVSTVEIDTLLENLESDLQGYRGV